MDHFLHELWVDKAKEEAGESDVGGELTTPEMDFDRFGKTSEVKLFKKIKSRAETDPNISEMVQMLEDSILRYYQTITELEVVSRTSTDKQIVQGADQARRNAHNTVIDNLNALSRYYGKMGIDNQWRSVIGLERTQVTTWVKSVAPYLISEKLIKGR